MSSAAQTGRRHGLVGTVHVVRPRHGEIPASITREADICHAARIVLDLTDASPLLDEDVHVLVDLCEHSDPQRVQILLPPDAEDALIDKLARISYSVARLGE